MELFRELIVKDSKLTVYLLISGASVIVTIFLIGKIEKYVKNKKVAGILIRILGLIIVAIALVLLWHMLKDFLEILSMLLKF